MCLFTSATSDDVYKQKEETIIDILITVSRHTTGMSVGHVFTVLYLITRETAPCKGNSA